MESDESGERLEAVVCVGGQSWGRSRAKHEELKVIKCFRCGVRLGCLWCVESETELICLHCNNWGHPAGVEAHGEMIPGPEMGRVNREGKWINYEEYQAEMKKKGGL